MSLIFALFALISIFKAVFAQNQPIATLYYTRGCRGSAVSLQNKFYPALSTIGWNDLAYSVKLRGPWLFYEFEHYNLNYAQMEYIYESSERCVDFDQIGGKVSSARFGGDHIDYRKDTISFYVLTYFQAALEHRQTDAVLELGGNIRSIIITGSSDWTIYQGGSYDGTRYCLKFKPSPTYDPAFLHDTTQMEVPVPPTFIRSVRKGCHADNVIWIERNGINGTLQQGNYTF